MKRTLKSLIASLGALAILISCLCTSAFAQESDRSVTEAICNYDGIYRFVNLGEKPDLSSGYIDFTFSDGTSLRLSLNDGSLPAFPDTSKPGLVTYSFEAYDAQYSLDFIAVDPDASLNRFTDIPKTYWGYRKILNTVSAGFFTGISQTEFAPVGNMTRAQFCQMIYNIYKNDKKVMTETKSAEFTDVAQGAWYYDAVTACAKSGIVNGVGDGMFNPISPISRQDVAIIMMRVLIGQSGIEKTDVEQALAAARASTIAANDFDETSAYAQKAVAAALGVIYFGDTDGNIKPKFNITRAECASLLSNYYFKGYNAPKIKRLVYLSPSNQMSNGYVGVNTNEGAQMQLVAAYAEKRLKEMGYEVYTADVKTSIKEEAEFNRAKEAASLNADVYVAIHSNAISKTNSGKYQGTTCFYNGQNKGARELSQAIYNRLSAFTPTNDNNGIHDDVLESALNGQKPYAEVRLPTMANVIVEVEYHDYETYAKWITKNIDGIGESIVQGIDDYLKTL